MALDHLFPQARRGVPAAVLAAALATALAAAPAHALRILDYNILNYPGSTASIRDPHFRTIIGPLSPDVVVVQEMTSQTGVTTFLADVLNTLEPGEWAAAPFVDGNDTDNALFYKPSRVELVGTWTFYPNPSYHLRLVACYRLRPVGYSSSDAEFRIYSQHLKASSGSSNEATRLAEATGIRDSMNAMPAGTHAILLGDFNIYSGAEGAFVKLKESQTNNIGRVYDPLNAPAIVWNTGSLAPIHTQSPCLSGCPSGFSTGGLDDRFDMFLPTLNMNTGEGLDLLVATYVPVGNDGLHYNLNIIDPPTIPEGATYANALFNASDHLPIRVDLQLPSMLQLASGSLDFGSVIVGAAASQNLSITNPAPVPADELDYSFSAPSGFSAPGGSFQLAAGAPAALQPIGMDTATPGSRAGNLVLTTDAPDAPGVQVPLSGTVLDHAVPSLDSLAVVTATTLDFGQHAADSFDPQSVRVNDYDYNPLQAELAVTGATITGGGGRFALDPSFDPVTLGETGHSFPVTFDAAGATQDSTYEATLTFTSSDQPLPGAVVRPDLVVTLTAQVTSGAVGAPGSEVPSLTRLYSPVPNPLVGSSLVRFDLAAPSAVRLEVFDLSGRRVTSLADGALEAGRHTVSWNGRRDDGSSVGPGLYFVRLSGRGFAAQTARVAVVR